MKNIPFQKSGNRYNKFVISDNEFLFLTFIL